MLRRYYVNFILIVSLCCVSFSLNAHSIVYIEAGGELGQGMAVLNESACKIIVPFHVIAQEDDPSTEENEEFIYPRINARDNNGELIPLTFNSNERYMSSIPGGHREDIVVLTVPAPRNDLCDNNIKVFSSDRPQIITRKKSGSLDIFQVLPLSIDMKFVIKFTPLEEGVSLNQGLSGSIMTMEGKPVGILVASSPDGKTGTAYSIEHLAKQLGAWVRGGISNLNTLDEALSIIERVKKLKPLNNIGQVDAFELLVGNSYEFSGTDFPGLSLQRANLSGAKFDDMDLQMSNFSDAILSNADLRNTSLKFSDFSRANLSNSSLQEIYAPYLNAEKSMMKNANFSRADLFSVNFKGANLRGVNFSGASLLMADLRNTDLRGANFENAILIGASLEGANIEGAIFSNTDITGVVGIKQESGLRFPEVCARKVDQKRWGSTLFYLKVSSRRRSNKYSSGYEYENLYLQTSLRGNSLNIANEHVYHELCASVDEDEKLSKNAPVYRNMIFDKQINFSLDYDLTERRGRLSRLKHIVDKHESFIHEHVAKKGFYRLETRKRIQQLVDKLDIATQTLSTPKYDCLDMDTARLLAEKFEAQYFIAEKARGGYSYLDQLAGRYGSEKSALKFIREGGQNTGRGLALMFDSQTNKHSDGLFSWGQIFKNEAEVDRLDLVGPVVDAFGRWTNARLKKMDNRVTLCMGHAFANGISIERSSQIRGKQLEISNNNFENTPHILVGSWGYWYIELDQKMIELIEKNRLIKDVRIEIDLEINNITEVYRQYYIVDAKVLGKREIQVISY